MIIVDTNVLSEMFRPAPAARVLDWFAAQEPASVYVTAVTQAEMLYGIEVLPAGKRKTLLLRAVEGTFSDVFAGRILSFDEDAARAFAKIAAGRESLGRPISREDAMIASIAVARKAALATRNLKDFDHCGVKIINPWTA